MSIVGYINISQDENDISIERPKRLPKNIMQCKTICKTDVGLSRSDNFEEGGKGKVCLIPEV